MTKFHEFPHMFATRGKPRVEIPYENRKKLPINLRGWYVHRLLVNAVAVKAYFTSFRNQTYRHWFKNQSTQELLSEISLDRLFSV